MKITKKELKESIKRCVNENISESNMCKLDKLIYPMVWELLDEAAGDKSTVSYSDKILSQDFKKFNTDYNKRKYSSEEKKIAYTDKFITHLENKFKKYKNEILDFVIEAMFYKDIPNKKEIDKFVKEINNEYNIDESKIRRSIRIILNYGIKYHKKKIVDFEKLEKWYDKKLGRTKE